MYSPQPNPVVSIKLNGLQIRYFKIIYSKIYEMV